MKYRKIFLCKKCGTLDYAKEQCPKCGSTEIDRADLEFLMFASSSVPGSAISSTLTNNRFTDI